ncbi:MAG: Ig-like domain-containing protein, partial [Solirubrobacteraceae bacterium]|nr:Ig-like domain-containing protein [Solirubrobacteraceae bacterium]
KIASWIDLTDEPSSARTKADVATAVGTVGASNLATRSEFAWWKSANNAKQAAASASEAQGKNTPVLTDEDDAAADGGWRVHQVTYPELVFLLKTETSKDAVLLFGGTWCPNTRPVISAVNEEAQENDVTVFNFDTILDGGTDGGGNASTNPLQVRNTAGTNAASTLKTTPSFLYAELVKQYLSNIKTEYDPTTNSTVTYYPGADNSKPLARINKLQVPFVVGYKGQAGDAPHGGATRQWIIDKGDGKYTEYMSQYWFTRPAANQLGITTIPLNAPIWTKINAALADFTWQTDPTALYANTATDADDTDFLAEGDKGKVTEAGGNVTVASTADPVNGTNVFDASPSTLATALSALGADAPANFAAAKAAYLAAKAANAPTVADLQKVVAAWGVAQIRKTRVNSTWGNATSPGSVAGGIAALRALDRFFAGLPGGVVSTQTVSAPSVDAATAPTISLAIANEFDRVPTGSVSVVVKKGGATVASTSAELGDAKATFTLPVLAAGEYEFTVSYAGGDAVAGFSKSGTLTVTALAVQAEIKPTPVPVAGPAPTVAPKPGTTVAKVAAGKVSGAVAKAPTAKKPGTYKVTVKAAGGKAAASGKVTLVLKKGKTKKTLTGAVKNGVVTIKVPKLAKGTWKVTISWVGDATYTGARVSGGSIKVKK